MKNTYTLKEYLAIDGAAEVKYEFERGEILAMSGGTLNHARIGKNIARHLSNRLEAEGNSCETFGSDARLFLPNVNSVVYPDAMVVCGEVETDENQEALTNPTLIFEVLSKSTEGYDRGEKFIKYQSIPSLQEYVLVNQYQMRVEVLRKREEGGWFLDSFYPLTGEVPLQSLGVRLTFEEIYENVTWETSS
jgi:Uma2 family endonuclease